MVGRGAWCGACYQSKLTTLQCVRLDLFNICPQDATTATYPTQKKSRIYKYIYYIYVYTGAPVPRLVGPRPSCFDVCYELSSKKKSAKLAKLLVEYTARVGQRDVAGVWKC